MDIRTLALIHKLLTAEAEAAETGIFEPVGHKLIDKFLQINE